jgi:hypothetical protein
MQAAIPYALDAVEPVDRPTALRSGKVVEWTAATGLLVFALNAFLSRDLFWDSYLDLAGGRYVAHHGIPHIEVWTVAGHGRPWIDQQWLAHLLYYLAWSAGGYALVALLSTLLVAGSFAGLAALISSRGVAPQRAALWAIGAFGACVGNTVIRAQSFAFPLFVALLALILRHMRKRHPSWELGAALALLVVWANLHGTVLMAAALIVVYCGLRAAGSLRRQRAGAAAVYVTTALGAALSFAATPYGLSAARYYQSLIGNGVVSSHILEWSPPSLGYVVSYGFFVVLLVVAGALAYAHARARRIEPAELALVVVLALLATQGVRYQVWFVIGGVSFAAAAFASSGGKPPLIPHGIVWLFTVGAISFAAFAAGSLFTTRDSRFERAAPRGAIAAVAEYAVAHPRARVLADDVSSSALLLLEPATAGRVGFDARLEQVRRADLQRWFDYLGVASPGWLRVTEGYDVLIASTRNRRLVAYLRGLRNWSRLYVDDDGIALVWLPSRA